MTERGFATVQYVVAAGFTLLFFVLCANVLVHLYARGAVRDALDEGVRAAVPAGASPAVCESRARAVLASIAAGPVVRVEALRCDRVGVEVVATARVRLESFLPALVPDWRLELRAAALPER
jgi:hypothetical protein